MTLTSRTDQPFWSDPDFTESGVRMAHPYPADYEPEPEPVPYWPLDWVFATVEAMRKRDAIIAERDAVLDVLADVVAECAEGAVSDVKLLACPNPWCTVTSDPRLSGFRYYGKDTFEVACRCGISGPVCGSEAEAIAAWNERPAPALTPKQAAADEIAKALQGIVAALELGGKMKRGQFYYYGVHDPAMTKPLAKAKAAIAKAGQP